MVAWIAKVYFLFFKQLETADLDIEEQVAPIVNQEINIMPIKKNILVILSFGHGANDPESGQYQCLAGGKEFTYPSGENVREGVLNRIYQKPIIDSLLSKGFDVVAVSHEWKDYTLSERSSAANKAAEKYNGESILICFHHNASRKHNAAGWEIWTTPGETKSDILADAIWHKHFMLKRIFPQLRLRSQSVTDGDNDFESNFYELRKFRGPAVLIENGFFDSESDLKRVRDKKYIELAADAIAKGVTLWKGGL